MDIKALVVDDEQLAREELCYLLGQAGGVTVVAQAANGVDALALIEAHEPELVFLDVQMPGLNGFEVARRVLERPEAAAAAEIVFVTAFDQYAIDAFQVDAVDYLLKPVDPERLEQAVQRARRRLAARGTPRPEDEAAGDRAAANGELERLVKRIARGQARPERLAVKVGERFLLVDAGDVIFATLADEVVTVATTGFAGTSNYRTLDDLQAQLDPGTFWRVHRAYLVNIHKIKEIVPWFSRNYILKMSDGKSTEIPVSRSQTKRLREYPAAVSDTVLAPAGLEPALLPLGDAGLPMGDAGTLPLTLAPVEGVAPEAIAVTPVPVAGPLAHGEPPGPSAWERLGEEVLTWFKTLASAAVYATLIVTFICQVARVEGHSMSPTLEDNDRLIVNKLIYRLSVPQRDDIVMLYYPVNPDKSFVKRVIAKENDVVRIVDGKVYVNGEAREDLFVPPTYRSHEDYGSLTVKPGYYFVMGDHRNNSSDSREWGEVPRKYIIGKVQLRWWPLSSARLFY